MNANNFITFFIDMLKHNAMRFQKELFDPFKMAPDIKENTIDFSSYSPLYYTTLKPI